MRWLAQCEMWNEMKSEIPARSDTTMGQQVKITSFDLILMFYSPASSCAGRGDGDGAWAVQWTALLELEGGECLRLELIEKTLKLWLFYHLGAIQLQPQASSCALVSFGPQRKWEIKVDFDLIGLSFYWKVPQLIIYCNCRLGKDGNGGKWSNTVCGRDRSFWKLCLRANVTVC